MSTVGRLSSSAARRAVLIGVVVFVSCLVGILSRLPGTLAVFWPANALLLGILFRSPRSATPLTWICVVAGYVGADLITGGAWDSTVWLNAANIVGVASGFYAFHWVDGEDRRLTSIQSVGYLVSMTVVGASMAALVGGIANRVLFGGRWWDGWLLWFSSEFVNYMTIVPLVLTFPSLRRVDRDPKAVAVLLRRSLVPTALLTICIILEWVIGGAGAIAFAMPALVTAALLTNVLSRRCSQQYQLPGRWC
ncbi:hypothetical protein QM716_12590 [Rhodococcus sp. IEGM 1409]|uniref:hypothetical protein n=1 Tax=Rhodococcus sp. IEGM 1409 TaxID=3047082 RepID=UPI0024B7FB24|nr:hypothetical protein [Rhodococcus sp. IEGM 1409]MDI9900691.1 hypothetical protein [Rhodococcus sp. IEGM 1409]